MPEAEATEIYLPVASADFPKFATATLKRQGCRIEHINERYRLISASDTELYPGRNRWELKYEIAVSWKVAVNQGVDGVEATVKIADKKNSWAQQFCDKRLEALVSGLLEDAKLAQEPPVESTLYGAARFATEQDLREAGYIHAEIDSERLLLAPWGDDGNEVISVPREETRWHGLICGPTGAGKSTGFFLPNLIGRLGTSAIVTEATAGTEPGELYRKTAGWRASHGHDIYVFNPADMASARINPLDGVLKAALYERVTIAGALTDLLMLNTTRPGAVQTQGGHWENAERQLLTVFIMHVAESDPENCHFGTIRKLMALSESKLQAVLLKSGSDFAAQEFEAFCEHSSPNYRHGVFAGLMTRLNPWTSEPIVRLTATTDIDVELLENDLFTFYLSVPSRKDFLKPIAALVFNYLLDLVTDNDFSQPLTLILDEFTNFGFIPGIDKALSIIRRRASCLLGIQDYKQLEDVYKRDTAAIIVSQLGTRVFFRPRQLHTAKEVSEQLGYKTVIDEQLSDTGHLSVKQIGRPLMTAAELMELKNDEVLILTPSTPPPPIRCERFTHKTFPVPLELPPPEREEHPVLVDFVVGKRKTAAEISPTIETQEPETVDEEGQNDKIAEDPDEDDHEPYLP